MQKLFHKFKLRQLQKSKKANVLSLIVSLLFIIAVAQVSLLAERLDCRMRSCGGPKLLAPPVVLFRTSSVVAKRGADASTICIGVPLRQEDAIDDVFLRKLRSNLFDEDLQSQRIVVYVTTRGEHKLEEALRISRELLRQDSVVLLKNRHHRPKIVIEALQPFALPENATLGTMVNHMLLQFTRTQQEGFEEAPCHHILILDPTRVPTSSSFLRTMIADVASSSAVAATCTTYRGGSAAPPSNDRGPVLDRGFNFTIDRKSQSRQPMVNRIDFNVSEGTPRAEVSAVQLISPYCLLIDWSVMKKRVVTPRSSQGTSALQLQIASPVAAEATALDTYMIALEDLKRWSQLLVTELTKVSSREVMRSLQETEREVVRKAFSASRDAGRLLHSLAGSEEEAFMIDGHTSSLSTKCHEQQQEGQTLSQPINVIKCLSTMVDHNMNAAEALLTVPASSMPREEQVGWSLSLRMYELLGNATAAYPHTLVSSGAACVLSQHNVPIALRTYATTSGTSTASAMHQHQPLIGASSFPLHGDTAFWKAHREVLQLYSELNLLGF